MRQRLGNKAYIQYTIGIHYSSPLLSFADVVACKITEWNPDNPVDLADMGWIGMDSAAAREKVKTSMKTLKLKNTSTESENSCFLSPSKSLEAHQQPYCPQNTSVHTLGTEELQKLGDFIQLSPSWSTMSRWCIAGRWADDPILVLFWLQKFVVSTRKKTGEKYPPKTIHMLLCGLQHHMKEQKEVSFNIFSTSDPVFKQLMTMCDSLYVSSVKKGLEQALLQHRHSQMMTWKNCGHLAFCHLKPPKVCWMQYSFTMAETFCCMVE